MLIVLSMNFSLVKWTMHISGKCGANIKAFNLLTSLIMEEKKLLLLSIDHLYKYIIYLYHSVYLLNDSYEYL